MLGYASQLIVLGIYGCWKVAVVTGKSGGTRWPCTPSLPGAEGAHESPQRVVYAVGARREPSRRMVSQGDRLRPTKTAIEVSRVKCECEDLGPGIVQLRLKGTAPGQYW